MTSYFFVRPVDVLVVRGNKSFGGDGQHGEAVMPPWPSLFAGAFRSALLGRDAQVLARFAHQGTTADTRLAPILGTPAEPGSLAIAWASLARATAEPRTDDTASDVAVEVEAFLPLPADLAAFDDPGCPPLHALHPATLPAVTKGSSDLPFVARLAIGKQAKPDSGRLLDASGLRAHLWGELPRVVAASTDLFRRETRLGIALDGATRTASKGALYTSEAIAFADGCGFLVGCEGDDGALGGAGFLRLGGDGKAARYRRARFDVPSVPAEDIQRSGRFRIILATPGIFPEGWLPPRVVRVAAGDYRLQGEGFSARLACAAVPRHETVSGWDLARWEPKSAQRTAPAGSVYWFDQLVGDVGKLADWVKKGLWGDNPDRQRRAEGFNRAFLGIWKDPV